MVGFYGKVPARGDFVRAGLPASFIEPWDAWLSSAVAHARGRLGDDWPQRFLSSPVWRFVLAPGVCGPEGWMGVVASSADGVGRLYPLTIAIPAPEGDPAQLIADWSAGFEHLIDISLSMIEGEAEFDSGTASLATVLSEHPVPALPAMPSPEAVLRPGESVRIPAVAPAMTFAAVCGPVLAHASASWTLMWRTGWGMPGAALIANGLPDAQHAPTLWESWEGG